MKRYIELLKTEIERQLQSGKYNSILNKGLNNVELYNELYKALINNDFLTKKTNTTSREAVWRTFNNQKEVIEALQAIGDMDTLNKFEEWLYLSNSRFRYPSVNRMHRILNLDIDLKQIDLTAKFYYFEFALANVINELQ